MNRTLYLILIISLLHLGALWSQEAQDRVRSDGYYSDRVTDVDGKPLIGINVRVRGKGTSVLTNSNGEFSIQATIGDIIILSKNGRTIDTYRYDGSLNYKLTDQDDVLGVPEGSVKEPKKSNKLRFNAAAKNAFTVQIDSALLYSKSNPAKSIDYIGKALNSAGSNKDQLAQSYDALGDVYMNLKQYDLATDNYELALANKATPATRLKFARAKGFMGANSESEQLLKDLLKSNELSTNLRIEVYENLGDLYFKQQAFEQALLEFRTALNSNRRTTNTRQRTNLTSKIAATQEALGNTTEAEGYLNRSIRSAEADGPKKAIIQNEFAADFYSKNNNVDKEVAIRKKTLETLESEAIDVVVDKDSDKKVTKSRAKLDLGNAYLKQNKLEEAIPLLEQSVADAKIDNDLETQKDAVEKLSEVYVTLGDEDKALANYKTYVNLVDDLYKQKEQEIGAILSLNRSLSEKQNRITSLEKDRALSESRYQLFQTENQLSVENDRRQKLTIYGLLIGLLLLLLSLFWMIRSNRQRKLANNLLALKSLRTQMNPHFIFNALNSVNSFIAKNDERTANRYLSDFSTLMRNVLINSEEDFIPLEKEIELLTLYLKLEHARFKDKFDYELTIDPDIDQQQFDIPPMLLQPYLENAVWHGLRYKDEKGFLKVLLSKQGEEVIKLKF